MKQIIAYILVISALFSCGKKTQNKTEKTEFTNDILLKTTPVKDQGHSRICWIYGMLATIETDRLMLGDSVNLSPAYIERKMLEEQSNDYYLKMGMEKLNAGGVSSMTLKIMEKDGIVPYDSYPNTDNLNHNALLRKIFQADKAAINQAIGLKQMQKNLTSLLDNNLGFLPKNVYMLGAEYTKVEFAHSVYKPGSYISMTSFTHHPFNSTFILEVPDNRYKMPFLNVTINKLVATIYKSISHGHAVCWEGDVSEPGFSFESGKADVKPYESTSQRHRQQEFEKFLTTDDHVMEIVGIAHDKKGHKYFIAKNSWGTSNPYSGFMYLSEDYIRLKTIAIFCLK